MFCLYVGFQLVGNWWTEHQLDATYGFPRTYQVDAIVYPGDTSTTPSHYIFLNLNGVVEIIELPHSDSAHARIYKGPSIISDQPALVPVTGEFKNVRSAYCPYRGKDISGDVCSWLPNLFKRLSDWSEHSAGFHYRRCSN